MRQMLGECQCFSVGGTCGAECYSLSGNVRVCGEIPGFHPTLLNFSLSGRRSNRSHGTMWTFTEGMDIDPPRKKTSPEKRGILFVFAPLVWLAYMVFGVIF